MKNIKIALVDTGVNVKHNFLKDIIKQQYYVKNYNGKYEVLKKKEQVILLMDCYRELLTDKQKQYLSLYYEEDLSLSEIAEDLSVSKNAVFDNIKRSVMSLEKYESKLHILENHRKRLNLINKIEEEKNKKHEDIDEYLEMLKNI